MAATISSAALITIAAIFAITQARRPPLWWQPIDPANAALQSDAQQLENWLSSQLTLIRPPAADLRPGEPWRSDIWRFAIDEHDANAWLNINLPKWLAAENGDIAWPDDVAAIRVSFTPGRMNLGAAIDRNDNARFLSASVDVTMADDGSLWMPARGLRLGNMPIPPRIAYAYADSATHIDQRRREPLNQLLRILKGAQAASLQPVIRMDNGRQVRILDIALENQRIVVTCQTELRASSRVSSTP